MAKMNRPIIVLGLVWTLSALYVWGFIDHGWIPHDDGSLAHMAERVLNGEMPHRDFDEIYTGGLSLLYAAAFKILGLNFISIRIVTYIFFLAFVPAVYGIALRFASPVIAAAVTLLAVVWSVPNYFTGLPSWYNLFFATAGTFAIIRHVETRRSRWLLIAGLCGGFSITIKVAGLYYVAAALLFLMYREQVLSSDGSRLSKPYFSYFSLLKGLGYLSFFGAVTSLLWPRLGLLEAVNLLLPAASFCGVLIWTERMAGQASFNARLKNLASGIAPFSLGIVAPILLFLIPYILSNSVGDLYRGVFLLSQKRLQYASADFPPFLTIVTAVPYGLLLFFNPSPSRKPIINRILGTIVVLALGLALTSSGNPPVWGFIWHSGRLLSVLAVLAGCSVIVRFLKSDLISSTKRQILILLVGMTALLSLIQFPFPAPIYYCYMSPLVALALLAIVTVQPDAPKLLHLGFLAFYLLFAVLWMNTGYPAHKPQLRIDLARGGIRVAAEDREVYTALVKLIRQHADSGYIYAAPDCPEVYFLTGLRNPTRKIFDFLSSVQEDASDMARLIQTKGIRVIVINRHPGHSPTLDSQVASLLQERFPESADIGKFTVRWTVK